MCEATDAVKRIKAALEELQEASMAADALGVDVEFEMMFDADRGARFWTQRLAQAPDTIKMVAARQERSIWLEEK